MFNCHRFKQKHEDFCFEYTRLHYKRIVNISTFRPVRKINWIPLQNSPTCSSSSRLKSISRECSQTTPNGIHHLHMRLCFFFLLTLNMQRDLERGKISKDIMYKCVYVWIWIWSIFQHESVCLTTLLLNQNTNCNVCCNACVKAAPYWWWKLFAYKSLQPKYAIVRIIC